MKEVGIYLITNVKTKHAYVGKSVELNKRIRRQKQMLRDNIHRNEYMQKHYNEYRSKMFKYEVLERCSADELYGKERFCIKHFGSLDRSKGYNLESGGNLGKIVSESTRLKKAGRNNPMYGKSWNAKQRENITKANRANSELLTEEDVVDIKTQIYNGATQKNMAEKYKTHISTISKITKGVNWYWVMPELTEELKNYKDRNNNKAIALFKQGVYRKQISKILHMDYRKLNKILKEEGLI